MKISKFLKSSPIFHIYLLSEKVFTPFQNDLKRSGLTFIQSMILTAIYFEEGESYPKRLADTLNTSPSNLSHSIKYLCSKGLLQKFMCEEDTRRTILKLTSKGSKKVSKLIYLYNQTQALFEDAISEKSIMSWNKKSSELIEAFQNQ